MIKTELVEMTPELASKLLANNPSNRNVSQSRVYPIPGVQISDSALQIEDAAE